MLRLLGIVLTLALLLPLVFASPAYAQAECQGCGNVGGCQYCTGDDENNELIFTVPECHVVQCFCQLTGERCGSFAYADFEADTEMTTAGTFVAERNVVPEIRLLPEINCSGLVIASAESPLARPEFIRLTPVTRVTEQ